MSSRNALSGAQTDQRIVVSLFDHTGNMVASWAKAGFLCYCVDLQHPIGECRDGNIVRVGADIQEWLPPYAAVKMLFAFPRCTHVAVSGARWFRDKGLGSLIEALRLFDATVRLAEWTRPPYMIENPVSTVSSHWRKPQYTFDPCDYGGYLDPPGDAYTKKACLWTGNGFVMPRTKRVTPIEGSKMHQLRPSKERQRLRSATPKGFAQAVFEANYEAVNNSSSSQAPDEEGSGQAETSGGFALGRRGG